jgi:hypothetical protein
MYYMNGLFTAGGIWKLKTKFIQASIVKYPNFENPFLLYTANASTAGMNWRWMIIISLEYNKGLYISKTINIKYK